MRYLTLIALATLGLVGCADRAQSPPAGENEISRVDPDNTAVNLRDRQDTVKTPIDQNENQEDVNITAEIRRRVVDSNVSVNAQNVKIITQNGRVTLRGPVMSDEERSIITDIATDVAGTDKVENQLEVKTTP